MKPKKIRIHTDEIRSMMQMSYTVVEHFTGGWNFHLSGTCALLIRGYLSGDARSPLKSQMR